MTATILDTVVVLRALFAPEKLSLHARKAIEDETVGLRFSVVSFWEIGIKMSVRGFDDLRLPNDWESCIPNALHGLGAVRLEIEAEDCRRVQDLRFHHRDPFDRMLVAQAAGRGLEIISPDRAFDAYGVRRIW